jgi:hypothetical protein
MLTVLEETAINALAEVRHILIQTRSKDYLIVKAEESWGERGLMEVS